jgi:hypothetical protein
VLVSEMCSRSRRRLLLTRTSPTCAGVENVNIFNTIDREVVSNRMYTLIVATLAGGRVVCVCV